MPGTLSDSWKLTKTSFRLIAEDRSLLVFPVVAALSILGVLALLIVGWVWVAWPLGGTGGGGAMIPVAVVLFIVAYFAMVFLSVYCTAALVGAATLKLSGQQPTASDGWKVARARIGRLFVWAMIAATVGLLIRLISSRVRGIGGQIIGLVGGIAWSVVTYFMIPVLLYEDLGAWASLKRSAHLFTSTLGRTLVSNIVISLLIGAGIVVAVVLGLSGLFLLIGGAVLLGVILIGVGIAVGVVVALLGATAEGILEAALYRYATTGKVDPDLLPVGYAPLRL